ncbi:MAG: hypothetical protein IRZ09_08910 [Variibacter sp.]|nr:hypothetical protein [Variibacter sp.]
MDSVHARKTRKLSGIVAACGLALGVAGCSADLALFKADSTWWSSGQSAASEPLSRAAPADALIGPDGSCPQPAGEVRRGVGLGMTECEVIHALGPTSLIDIGSNERGERAVVLTYPEGAHAGIYRFTAGVLVSVERLPEAPKAQRPQRRQRPRQQG